VEVENQSLKSKIARLEQQQHRFDKARSSPSDQYESRSASSGASGGGDSPTHAAAHSSSSQQQQQKEQQQQQQHAQRAELDLPRQVQLLQSENEKLSRQIQKQQIESTKEKNVAIKECEKWQDRAYRLESDLQAALSEKKATAGEQEIRLRRAEGESERLREAAAGLERELGELRSEKEKTERALEEVRQRIVDQKEDLDTRHEMQLRQESARWTEEKDALLAKLNTFQTQVEQMADRAARSAELESAMSGLEANIDQLQQRITQEESSRAQLAAQLAERDAELAAAREESEGKLRALQLQLDQGAEQLAKAEQTVQQLQQQREERDAELSAAQEGLSTEGQERAMLADKLKAAESRIASLQEAEQHHTQESQEHLKQMEAVRCQLSAAEEAKGALHAQLDTLQEAKDALERQLATAQQQQQQQTDTQHQQHKHETAALQADLQQLREELAHTQSDRDALQQQVTAVESSLTEREAALTEAQRQLTAEQAAKEAAQRAAEESDADMRREVEQLSATLRSRDESIQDLQQQLAGKADKLSEMEASLLSAQQQLRELGADLTAEKSAKDRLSQELQSAHRAADDAQEGARAEEESVAAMQQQLREKEEELAELRARASASAAAAAQPPKDDGAPIKEMEERLLAAAEDIAAKQQQIAALKSETATLKRDKAALLMKAKEKTAALQTKVDELQAEHSAVKEQLREREESGEKLASQNSKFKGLISQANGRMEEQNRRIAELQADLTHKEEQHSVVSQQCSRLRQHFTSAPSFDGFQERGGWDRAVTVMVEGEVWCCIPPPPPPPPQQSPQSQAPLAGASADGAAEGAEESEKDKVEVEGGEKGTEAEVLPWVWWWPVSALPPELPLPPPLQPGHADEAVSLRARLSERDAALEAMKAELEHTKKEYDLYRIKANTALKNSASYLEQLTGKEEQEKTLTSQLNTLKQELQKANQGKVEMGQQLNKLERSLGEQAAIRSQLEGTLATFRMEAAKRQEQSEMALREGFKQELEDAEAKWLAEQGEKRAELQLTVQQQLERIHQLQGELKIESTRAAELAQKLESATNTVQPPPSSPAPPAAQLPPLATHHQQQQQQQGGDHEHHHHHPADSEGVAVGLGLGEMEDEMDEASSLFRSSPTLGGGWRRAGSHYEGSVIGTATAWDDVHKLRQRVRQLESSLVEERQQNSLITKQIAHLKHELRAAEATKSVTELGNQKTPMEYLKNILKSFLETDLPGGAEHESLVPVLLTLLHFPQEEAQQITEKRQKLRSQSSLPFTIPMTLGGLMGGGGGGKT